MNARAISHADQRASPQNERARPRWKVITKEPKKAPPGHIPLEQLRKAASPGVEQIDLPYRAHLAALFKEPVPTLDVRTGPVVEASLDHAGAEAAVQDGVLFLRRDTPMPIVAHELAHVLQERRAYRPEISAEGEAHRVEQHVEDGRPLPPIEAGLSPGTMAFRSRGAGVLEETPSPSPQPSTPQSVAEPQAEARAPAPTHETTAPLQGRASPTPPAPADAPRLDSAPEPEIDLDAAAAAADAAIAELDSAEDADGVIAAYAAAPPSVKAREAAGLDGRVEAASTGARAAEDAALPDLQASMSPGDDLPEMAPVHVPDAAVQALEDQTPPPAPLPEIAPTADPGRAGTNSELTRIFERDFTPGDRGELQRSLDSVTTHDGAVDTSAGVRPVVPLEGESDPERVGNQEEAAATQANAAQQEAIQAVLDGPGPERAQLHEMSETIAIPQGTGNGEQASMPAVDGPAEFAAKPLDATTIAIFDNAHAAEMEASLTAANDQIATAAGTRQEDRQAELTHAEEEQTRLNREADQEQRDEVVARRSDIQQARQHALNEQAEETQSLRTEAETARNSAYADIETEVTRTEDQIDRDFEDAESRASAEVERGERDASDARDSAEREAENQSWWDRAVNWVKDQLKKLTDAINAIFDAVRAAVRAIIDAVKDAALALISMAASLINGIIQAFGELLHTLVNRLLAEAFPEIAAALNAAIDAAVNAATAAVNRIANALKAAVEFLANALAAALDAILAAWQAAINVALTLVSAALSGDWAALARLILTPILMVLGVDPDSFFLMFARAAEALDRIVDDPATFVTNLLDTVKGGISKFADNFPHHLIAGIILWLTGPLGSRIQMPATFDLAGVLDIARQLLGLTLDTLRRVAVRVIGERAVERIEYVLRYVGSLISGGWQGLWEQLSNDLAMLRDLVLGQIRDFLLERVVVASILWLASMFNPVGALVKLVMTIWNFIQFLRTQLAKILAVVQTVVNSMWQIATRVLEPPIAGIERVLAGLLPVVLDLLARMMGVTGVPDKVQRIIGGVRARIEAAIEKLMRRILSAFGINGQQVAAGVTGEIMAPIQFRAGNETHTIFIEDEGETVRPMIRSNPSPLVTWLDERPGQPFTQLAESKGWQGETRSGKRAELLVLIAAAKEEEAALDAKAEAAEDALNAAANENASDAVKAEAAAKVAETQGKGEQTKSAVAEVLEFFGIRVVPLHEKFAAELSVMASALSENLRQQVLPRLDVVRYTPLDWTGFGIMLASDGAATEVWRRPASSTGAARRFTNKGFSDAIAEKAKEIVKDKKDTLSDPEALVNADGKISEDKLNQFFGDYLVRRLSSYNVTIIEHLLKPGGIQYAVLIPALTAPITDAVTAMCSGGEQAYDHSFTIVTGSYFKSTIVNDFHNLLTTKKWGSYFHDDRQNAVGSGAGAALKPIGFFLRKDATGATGSKRAQKNGQRLADAVRGADPGQHEWVASRFAATIIRNAADEVAAGRTDQLDGLCELIQFQHIVRTPTRQLIFRPDGPYPAQKVEIGYHAFAHRSNSAFANIPEAQLPDEQRALWYPQNRLHQNARVGILQGHPGAIYARVSGGMPANESKQQVAGHNEWDAALAAVITRSLGDGRVSFREVYEMGENILRFHQQTIWDGKSLPAGNDLYDEYFNSGGGAVNANTLRTDFAGYFTRYEAELEAQLNRVRSA